MIKSISDYIKANELIKNGDQILVAVSGGMDSMVLLSILIYLDIKIEVAHCNFKLRGEESDEDETFVKQFARKHNIKFHLKSFDVETYVHLNKCSIQVAARDLRYNWFNQLIDHHNLSAVAVGTHVDDSIETFMLNAIRGTGISGLRGIKPKNKNVIRPLLSTSKEQIEKFALDNQIPYRQDSSNQSIKYARNKIRHEIIPLLRSLNPGLTKTFLQNFQNLKATEVLHIEGIKKLKEQCCSVEKNRTIVDLDHLKKTDYPENYLYEILSTYNCSLSDCVDILNTNLSGKEFHTKDFRIVVNRNKLLIEPNDKSDQKTSVFVHDISSTTTFPIKLSFESTNTPSTIDPSKNIAFLDEDKVNFPLEIRAWQKGDYFYPLGMSNRKKISDFLIDQKISLLDKQNLYVLTSNNQIIWVIGHRIDNRYKLDPSSQKALKITLD